MENKLKWTLKEIVVMAVLAVAFGALYMGWVAVWGIANGLLGPIGLDLVYGVWFMASITCAYIIRKPGIALGAELFAAAAEILMGTPAGIGVLIGAAIQGIGCEVVFAATRYKKYSTPVLMASGMGASVTSFIYTLITYGYIKFPPVMLISMLLIRLASGAILAGLAGKLVGDGLAATGVLGSFPLGRERAQRKVESL